MVTRSKPPSSSNHITQPSNPSRLTAPTVSTRTKAVTKDAQLEDPAAQGKRKRSTLGEVTVNKPKARGAVAEKGKAKEDASQAAPVPSSKFAGVVIKDKPATSTAIPQSLTLFLPLNGLLVRQPQRTMFSPVRRQNRRQPFMLMPWSSILPISVFLRSV